MIEFELIISPDAKEIAEPAVPRDVIGSNCYFLRRVVRK
jgi:hypothetical protein